MAAPTPKEIRDAFADYRSEWQPIHDQSDLDMAAISVEGPWSDEDRKEREDNGRPCLHLDQINQYLNQTIGNARMNKRAVKASPTGAGANEQDAAKRSSAIMGIEEASQAQPIYLNAYESMLQRSFGFALVRSEYKDQTSFDQTIVIKPVPNPRSILLSPYYKQPNASDVPDGFVLDRITKEQHKARFPNVEIKDFVGEDGAGEHVSDWVSTKTVQLAEYWKIETEHEKLLLVLLADGTPKIFTEKEWEQAKQITPGEVKRTRVIDKPRVVQYLTNGLEILDTIPWAGSRIPIISCLGPERWVNRGGTAKRELLSMVRFARDPQMLADYFASGECEEAGQIPKAPFIGAKGQFESAKDTWEEITKTPHAFVEYDVVIDGVTGEALPPPSRPQWTPNFQIWEIAKDSAGRSVQQAMGIAALPTAAARRSEKSGVALDKIDNMEALGTFQFTDRYENGFLHNMGWQINELITPILDTEQQLPIAQPDGTRKLLHVVGNTSHPIDEKGAYNVQGLPEDHMHTGKGEYGISISTGPSKDSERDAQAEFVDNLLTNIPNLPQPGSPAAKILALAVRMRPDLGPIGKQIADVLDPPDPSNLPPEAQAVISQMQGQLTAAQQELAALHMDRAGRVMEQDTKKQIETMKIQSAELLKKMELVTRVVVAQLQKQSRSSDQEAQADAERELQALGFAHEHLQQAGKQAHELAMRESAPAPIPDPAAAAPGGPLPA